MVGLRHFFTLPGDVIYAWPLVLVIHALWGQKGSLVMKDGVLFTRLSETSWPSRTWYKNWGATTFGHSIMLAHNSVGEEIIRHELDHVRRIEASSMLGFALFILGAASGGLWWIWLLMWPITPGLIYVCGGLVGVLRNGHFYRDNNDELSARAMKTFVDTTTGTPK